VILSELQKFYYQVRITYNPDNIEDKRLSDQCHEMHLYPSNQDSEGKGMNPRSSIIRTLNSWDVFSLQIGSPRAKPRATDSSEHERQMAPSLQSNLPPRNMNSSLNGNSNGPRSQEQAANLNENGKDTALTLNKLAELYTRYFGTLSNFYSNSCLLLD
jgi:hypothetical protein